MLFLVAELRIRGRDELTYPADWSALKAQVLSLVVRQHVRDRDQFLHLFYIMNLRFMRTQRVVALHVCRALHCSDFLEEAEVSHSSKF